LVFSELLYRPAPGSPEFVELYNSNPFAEDVSGYRLVGSNSRGVILSYEFPAHSVMGPGGFLVVAQFPETMKSRYGLTEVAGPYHGTLAALDTLQLVNAAGAVYLQVPLPNPAANPFVAGADRAGHSLVLARPSLGEAVALAWGMSRDIGGSPGRAEPAEPEPLRTVRINEAYAPRDAVGEGFIELYNHSNEDLELSGCFLSNTPFGLTNHYRFPTGSVIRARSFLAVPQPDLGFTLRSSGDVVFFVNAAATRVIDCLSFEGVPAGVSVGRHPDGAARIYPLAARTPAAANGPIRGSGLVINELMFASMESDQDDYVELFNPGPTAVSLAGWKLDAGGTFTFPDTAVIPPGGYFVAARNVTNLVSRQAGALNCTNAVGDFRFRMSNNGDRVVLWAPTDGEDVIADEVTYGEGGRWGKWSHRGGSSLELIDAHANHRLADNWADSDETARASWTPFEATGVLDLGGTYHGEPIDDLEVLLLGEGECLLDEVEVIPEPGGANRVANPGFEAGLQDWVMQGDHAGSLLHTNGGYLSRNALHIRAGARGDTGANHIRAALTAPLVPGQTVTLRARVRWLSGWPEILLRLRGNYLEAVGRMRLPLGPGTPGRPNSRTVANAGPAIADVTHRPVLPSSGQPVVVTAILDDPDGLSSAWVHYRVDPGTNDIAIALRDDGAGGDQIAGDGVYSATLPGQPAGVLVAFYVEAFDAAPSRAVTRFPRDAPARECLVRFGEAPGPGGFGTYRLWLTQAALDAWSRREVLSNERVDGTLIYGDFRAIYNVGGRYAGSPYHQDFDAPTGKPCHYSFDIPGDDKLLGTDTFNKLHAPGNAPFDDPTILTEQTAYTLARHLGLPWNYKRYVNFFVNGIRRGTLMEDTQVPNGDVTEELFPGDTGGDLYKLQSWNEFDRTTSGRMDFTPQSWCTLSNYLTTGGTRKLARYRWNFLPRSAHITANRYQPVFDLLEALRTPAGEVFAPNLERVADMEQWMRTFAVEHAAGNWDAFGGVQGQNMYGYTTQRLRWNLLIWDFEVVLGNSSSDGPIGDDLFRFNPTDPGLARIYAEPAFARDYWRALQEIATGALAPENIQPGLDAKYAAFQADGLAVADPSAVKTWLTARRGYLLERLGAVAAPFSVAGLAQRTVTNNLVRFTGTAPFEVRSLRVNGTPYSLTWTSVTNWVLAVPMPAATNVLELTAYDRRGNPLDQLRTNLMVIYTGPFVAPQDAVGINEIYHHPTVPGSAFLEVFNRSGFSFDLSNWKLQSIPLTAGDRKFSLTFPPGAVLTNGQYLVLAEDWRGFAAAFGNGIPLPYAMDGEIGTGDSVLLFSRPATNETTETVVRIQYGTVPPWPLQATGGGASLQVVDPAQDGRRLVNWTAGPPTPGAANSGQHALPPFPPLWLSEVELNNTTGPADGQGELEPWIEIYNSGPAAISLSGFALADNYTNLVQWRFPARSTIDAGERLLVWVDGEPAETSEPELHTSFRLANRPGSVVLSRLVNGQPQLLDYLDYPAMSAGSSYGNLRDGDGTERGGLVPSPGATNTARLRVFINEWMADNRSFLEDTADDDFEDWIELYNGSATDVDLTGYWMTDASGTHWDLPPGTVLPARGFLLIWADGETNQNGSGSAELHARFKLDKDGDHLELRGPDAALVDAVTLLPQTNDVSRGRLPDGSDHLVDFTQSPSPGSPNQQDPFELLVPGTVTVAAGQPVAFMANVRNAPVPPWVITFSLDESAPAGAVLEPCFGGFSWVTTAHQVGTHRFTVHADNNGSPPFRLSAAVTVTVTSPLEFIDLQRWPNGQVTLQWKSTPGRSYLVQFRDELNAGGWQNASAPLTTTSGTMSFSDSLALGPQRFYRVLQLP
jgi:hypothetical protein